ncbi:N-acetylmannosamine-6-phosphate 2-epimerase [Aliivibrio fischeri]|uniref:N-acetylmannosamine-6-phosphate 2-epimerase n=1 Tax=Aliivibrio fischeri TaxID=668 RepID=UPI0012D9E3BF|nr:N-acetylmannosamine-6-phosphate 2-epimerase [Aliivibrio fischeri]MUH98549.1 putative N-acetylmannosamine-6-phosphate 2-epimerase [Aliivibrio fischeri]MUI62176.1 putative N-acetylmannosamine-6-phosphate 2-epimerase [Aliivibrio fischeri]MUK71002.1 putative N-acetylmannosamine-6-phosphate 2-epimerase [Aliivibrio fischeri]MUK74351.1 putative N-acetylmannosamine-6-phosphate 2-epimerase [Aliivibrio fischeri]
MLLLSLEFSFMGSNIDKTLNALSQGFVSSCQPVDDGPMDKPEIVAAMAMASVEGGAIGLRIEGIDNLKAVRPHVSVPIIGIIKRDLDDSEVRITPYIEDVIALKEAGADIIAIDATHRPRPVPVEELVKKIQSLGCLVMADSSTYEEGMFCHGLGVEIIGTTLSGYTTPITPKEPDFQFIQQLANQGCFVMAEGRFNSPQLAREAIEAGASCVTVGSAITRIEHICGWFKSEVELGKKNMIKDIA